MKEGYVYLVFNIYNESKQKIAAVKYLMHKERDIEKIKNPDLISDEVVGFFKEQVPIHKDEILTAYHVSDYFLDS